ncbi:MAG: 1-deoxy-D-xylulose-5-phosphate synthase [Clostridia bacterium]|nr:1-deoxy-D-xylulose-5-phosphate synthase [Clostridia bacterium]
MTNDNYSLLESPTIISDIKEYSEDKLNVLCDEIRAFLISSVKSSGGHLASNLGVVELTVALYRAFSFPEDSLVFDVGHQSYVHKMLSGRINEFDTLRKPGGLSGFTKRAESQFDSFGAGHSSTSLSAAIGIAEAKKMSGDDSYTIALIGDGSYTGGLIHEALNNIDKSLRLIVILNENEMSISPITGRFSKQLQKIRVSKGYRKAKRRTRNILYKIPLIGKPIFRLLKNTKKLFKNLVYHSNYFEDLGLYYLGPVDGHNLTDLDTMFKEAKLSDQSVIIHVCTTKGKGYEPAEKDPDFYHNIMPDESEKKDGFSRNFGKTICELAEKRSDIVAITAAMASGCGLNDFSSRFPDRFFDVGIAEEHALVFACGLATKGYRPVFAVYSTFLQRCYDNILHDAALQALPITVCIDRAGLSSSDGPTHNGIFDVAFLSEIPDIELYTPFDYESQKECLEKAVESSVPSFVRYPCGNESPEIREHFSFGEFGIRYDFSEESTPDAVIITYGRIVSEAIRAANDLKSNNINAGIILLEQLIPYAKTKEKLASLMANINAPVLFVEEGIKNGGAGMIILSDTFEGRKKSLLAIEGFGTGEKGKTLYESCGISSGNIKAAVLKLINS